MRRYSSQYAAMLVIVSALFGSMPAAGQSSRPADAPARPADEASFAEAIAAYDRASKALVERDYDVAVRVLADNRRPIIPPEKQDDAAAVAKAAAKFRTDAERVDDIKQTVELTRAVLEIRPRQADATMQEVEIRGKPVTLLRVPLKGSGKIATERGHHGRGGWTSDGEGNLIVLMCRHDGQWFWNPFGW